MIPTAEYLGSTPAPVPVYSCTVKDEGIATLIFRNALSTYPQPLTVRRYPNESYLEGTSATEVRQARDILLAAIKA